jgi:hypothetical protein
VGKVRELDPFGLIIASARLETHMILNRVHFPLDRSSNLGSNFTLDFPVRKFIFTLTMC